LESNKQKENERVFLVKRLYVDLVRKVTQRVGVDARAKRYKEGLFTKEWAALESRRGLRDSRKVPNRACAAEAEIAFESGERTAGAQ
jgi:hypothetical protein